MKGLCALTISETRLFLRDRASAFYTLAFPALLLAVLGSIPFFGEPVAPDGPRLIEVYVPVVIALVLAAVALQGLPSLLASYREQGVLRRLRVTPVRPETLLTAVLIMMLGVTAVSTVLVLAVGRIAFGVALPAAPLAFAVALLFTAAAIYGLGLLVAAVASTGRAGNAIGSLVFFPMLFFGGMWLPRDAMPTLLRTISDFTPLGAGVGAVQAASAGAWPQLVHLGVLLAWAVAAGALAARLFRWE
ncbi:ABC transporter permease [Pseudonocardia asaccharolytica]|uniref:Transport permease protein n=1 Tax=Pseudonocardia asaccharolytica DSM 44247 = NBRC 16224 TaxID=1123024 RepID=A0A511D137_9PSEU|nr:ABC transporter permease [Pseudonocardia asaccharolytica]GEL18522.1 transport permease protein [Pseudonocardia asaccharolytica DSM 44247 = NBRC 16224]